MRWPVEIVTGRQLCEWHYRYRHKRWCNHVLTMTDWRMANCGMNRYRFCTACGRWQWV